MTDATKHAVGLSVGTTTLAAVTSDNAVRRPAALTLRGVTITDFVDRVGDPVGIVAPDGSSHRAEQVLAEALRDLAYEATRGAPLPELVAITVPAHWRPAAVEALTRALSRLPEWIRRRPVVLSEVAAAMTALQTNPGLPTRGVIAVCDFGGSGTSITLVDAANGCRPIGPTVRHLDFAGDMVDQTLLTHVIGELAGAGSVDLNSTSAIGSLWRLRAQCRGAKERLSAAAVTAMPVELPEFRGDVRLTRTELDALLREPLAGLLGTLQDTLRRNGIHPADLSAVASIGGGAGMAAVTTTLSEHLRVPVITTPRPALIPATGAALRVLRGTADDAATALATAVRMAATPVADRAAAFAPALAWSEAADELTGPEDAALAVVGVTGARPRLDFEVDEHSASAAEPEVRWYRRPLALMVASIVVILGAIGAVGVVLTNDSSAAPASTPTPSISSTPEAPAPVVAQPPPAEIPAEAPAPQPAAPRTVYATPAPVTRTQVVQQQAPPVTVQAPAPAPADPPAPETETVTQTVTPTQQAPATETPAPPAESTPPPASNTEGPRRWLPTIPPIPTIPGLPPLFPRPPQP
jgi:hypothetical protein